MRKRHNEEQTIRILGEALKGNASEVCRKHGIRDATLYNWRKRYEGMGVADVRKLRMLDEENRKRADSNKRLRRAIRRLAFKHKRYGYRMLYRKIKQEGWQVNHKRVERLYRADRLQLRIKRHRKRATIRVAMPPARWRKDCWSIDFMSDAHTNGRALRFFTAIDDASRE